MDIMTEKDFIKTHQKIISALKDIGTKDACTSINILARKVESDPRTVKKHLEIAEIDDIGRFADSDKKIFCLKNSIKDLFSETKKGKNR